MLTALLIWLALTVCWLAGYYFGRMIERHAALTTLIDHVHKTAQTKIAEEKGK